MDELKNALITVGEVDSSFKGGQSAEKFSKLKTYLLNTNKSVLTLTFKEIEDIIGSNLCKSAFNYSAYWQPSATHVLPNTIIDAGYRVSGVDLLSKRVILEKQ